MKTAWIKVDIRLPEITENYEGSITGVSSPVLVLLKEPDCIGSRVDVARCFRGGRGDCTSIHWDTYDDQVITHWAELPELTE